MTTPDKTVPQSIEAEEAVLGSLLIDPEGIFRVLPFLHVEDFYLQKHRWIYAAMIALHERREPIDFLTLPKELEQREQLEAVGGAAYISQLSNAVPSAINVETYGRLVEQAAVRRRLLDAASEIARLAYDEELSVEHVVDGSEKALFAVSQQRAARDLQPIQEVVRNYYDRVEYLYAHRGEPMGVPTGFADIDKLLGGFQRSDLLILAARPGVGKTSLLLTFALKGAQKGKRMAIFSLEMSAEQIVQRMVAAVSRIDAQRLRLGDLHDDEWPRFTDAIGYLSELPIFIDDTPSITSLQLRTKCRRLAAEHGLDMIMVDYLQLMSSDLRSENRVQEVSYLSRSLKGLARELDVPLLTASQLSRAVEQRTDKTPVLSDLRESGCLTGDTMITLAESGRRLPIRELEGKSDFAVWALNTSTFKLERVTVTRAFCTGVKPVHRLTTCLGRTLRATANHRFLTIQGWKRLDELQPGEFIALPRTLDNPVAASMSAAELALLAHLIGDGCTLPRHALQYTTSEYELAELVQSLALEVFGDLVKPRIQHEKRWYQVYLTSTRHLTHEVRNPITDWLQELGAFGLRSFEKRVPEKVFEQPAPSIALFLRHLWATDGCIHLGENNPSRIVAYYATSSQRLAMDVQTLLLRLGINARIKRISQSGKGRDQYHVIITGKLDLDKFIAQVGAVCESRLTRLGEMRAALSVQSANTNRDVIPSAVWRMYVTPAMAAAGKTARQFQAEIGSAYSGTALYKRNLGRERAERVAAVVGSAPLLALAQSDVYWDKISAIEPAGEEPAYDLTVPDLHNFVADNIIVHNSIEQDADVVMFIYRDELYHPETERQHVADIIVSKHRSGPTGTVQLFFDTRLTEFRDASTRLAPDEYVGAGTEELP